jgi:hypothetical protein
LNGLYDDARDAEQAYLLRCAARVIVIDPRKLYGVTPRRKVPGKDKDLAFGLRQNVERLRRATVYAKLNMAKVVRRVGEHHDNARAGPVKRDTARGAGAIPNRSILVVESPVPAFVFNWIESGRITPDSILECVRI